MRKFIHAFSWLYACKICATDFRDKIKDLEPALDTLENEKIIYYNIKIRKKLRPQYKMTDKNSKDTEQNLIDNLHGLIKKSLENADLGSNKSSGSSKESLRK